MREENKEKKIIELSNEKKIKKLKKINLLSIITRNKFKNAKLHFKSLNKNLELSRNKTNNNLLKSNNYPYLSENSIKNLTSREPQGNYNFDTILLKKNY
jgi:hypothetical protein